MKNTAMPVCCDLFLFLILLASGLAHEIQQKSEDTSSYRGIGIEEVAIFFIGLGAASAIALSMLIGPMFAIFYSTMNGLPYGPINGGNAITPTPGGTRSVANHTTIENVLREKILSGLKLLDNALRKYGNIGRFEHIFGDHKRRKKLFEGKQRD